MFFLFLILAYCLGSINFSILFFKLMGKEDPRTAFSGNPGVTNVFRQAGWPAAALVLLLDTSRSAALSAVALIFLAPPEVVWSGLALLLGNRYPCFHQFRGGKGVANYLGFSIVIVPLGALASCLAWFMAFRLFRRPFIASFFLVAMIAGATIHKWNDFPMAIAGVVATSAFIVYNHRGNIAEFFNSGPAGPEQ